MMDYRKLSAYNKEKRQKTNMAAAETLAEWDLSGYIQL